MKSLFKGPPAHVWLSILLLGFVFVLIPSLRRDASSFSGMADMSSHQTRSCGHRCNAGDSKPPPVSSNLTVSSVSLVRRQDYSCGPGRPCSNGACCGGSGFCGYGPTYCGAGCVSNCGAVAECGQNAVPAGKKCPLNTCCSEFGFCGTTKVSKND